MQRLNESLIDRGYVTWFDCAFILLLMSLLVCVPLLTVRLRVCADSDEYEGLATRACLSVCIASRPS